MNVSRYQKGMTLVELLVVIFILAALAGTTVSLVGVIDDRERHTMTTKRLGEIRAATLGPDIIAPNGNYMTGGFLQDMGYLPRSDEDLMKRPSGVSERAYSEDWRTWYGWAGPYISAPPLRKDDTTQKPYDGWGNDFYGWPTGGAQPGDDFAVRSHGADTGEAGDDIPHSSQPLIRGNEWVADIGEIRATIINMSSSAVSGTFYLKVVIPEWEYSGEAALEVLPTDSDRYYSDSFLLNLDAAPEGAAEDECDSETVTFAPGFPRLIPNGSRMLFLVSIVGETFQRYAYCELKLSGKLTPSRETKLRIRD